ncbi:MAG: hypothetical protein WBP81_15675 [Solirubrobacteraceae bacterium]
MDNGRVHGFRKPIDEMESINDGLTKLAGAELGVESFGMQVFDFSPGFPDYPEHDHSHDGQEEIYVVLRGSAEFELDGERVPVDGDRMVRVGASTRLSGGWRSCSTSQSGRPA